MGRKTWDSIPPKFRPLKDRLNIVITRSADAPSTPASSTAEPVRVSSLEKALEVAQQSSLPVGRVFVMGGGQIYKAALEVAATRRVLLTSIERDFECDTFFPVQLGDGGGESTAGWVKRSREELHLAS